METGKRLINPDYKTALETLSTFIPICYQVALETHNEGKPLRQAIIDSEVFFTERNELVDLATQNTKNPDELRAIAVGLKDYAQEFVRLKHLADKARNNQIKPKDDLGFRILYCNLVTYQTALERMLVVVFEHFLPYKKSTAAA